MEEKNLIEVARKENNNTAGWLLAGILLIILSIISIVFAFFSKTTHSFSTIAVCILCLPFGIGFFAFAIWDIKRPNVLITMENNRESINVYFQSQWINIRISDIIVVDHRNYHSRHRTLSSGWLSIETTSGEYRIKNIKDVAHVWYDIKYLSENKEV